MPLPAPKNPRKRLHTRRITGEGFRREDGLWDIEVHLSDIRAYPFLNKDRGEIKAGEPLHDMWMRVTINRDMVIQEVEAVMDASPFHMCPQITPNYANFNGVQMGRGFRQAIKERVGGVKGCTHLRTMLEVAAMVAFQTIMPDRFQTEEFRGDNAKKPDHINTCHALASDSPVVAREWPDWYTGEK